MSGQGGRRYSQTPFSGVWTQPDTWNSRAAPTPAPPHTGPIAFVRHKIRRLRQGPIVADRNLTLFFPRVELDCQVGLADQSGPADQTNPQVGLSCSNDGGMTWGPEAWRSLG